MIPEVFRNISSPFVVKMDADVLSELLSYNVMTRSHDAYLILALFKSHKGEVTKPIFQLLAESCTYLRANKTTSMRERVGLTS